tara:strand:+ start:347 stop:589 length:243 start_codon:yes stop_codon:yes gene_type:complete
MFNYGAIDKTPTVKQVKAIIDYMEKDPDVKYNFANMMGMNRTEPNKILLDLNDAHFGTTYEVVFEEDKIIVFNETGSWMS